MTYEEAQSKIDDTRLQDELSRNLRKMNEVAKVLRQRRSDRGALSLASPEVKFQIDTETHDPLDVGMYQVILPDLASLKRPLRSLTFQLEAIPQIFDLPLRSYLQASGSSGANHEEKQADADGLSSEP